MIKGRTSPAINNGIPKINPIVFPLPKVRLITSPPINKSKPTAMLKEKL
jgi:hypothetical protein